MKKLLFATLLLLSGASVFAQTKAERDLETAVRKYNAMRDFAGSLKPSTVTDADITSISNSVEEGLTLLDPIIKTESGQIADVARYFRANYLYQKGFTLGMKGRMTEAFDLLRSIDSDINGFTSSRFPLRYVFEGRNFIIKWENFAPTQAEYNVSMTEFYFGKKDFTNALAYAAKANENSSYLSDYLRTINNYWIVQMKSERGEKDPVALEASLVSLESYGALDADERQGGGSDLVKILDRSPEMLDNVLTARPDLVAGGTPYARAARVLKAEGRGEQYRGYAAKAIRAGYRDREFLNQSLNDAATAKDRPLGLLAAEALGGMTAADDCAGLARLADQYELIGERTRAADIRAKSNACFRKQKKAQVRASRDFGLYLGSYVFPLFRRDWGAVMGIQTRKVYIEASYQRANNNRDRLWDLRFSEVDNAEDEKVYWNGYYSHLAINWISKDSRRGFRPYTGVLLGYNHRAFDAVDTDVFNRETNLYLGRQRFEPVQESYILMLNLGAHSYGKLLAADLYASIGATYNMFERGNEAFNDSDTFLYENLLLENRKENRVAFIARVGLTIGLQFGSNNRR